MHSHYRLAVPGYAVCAWLVLAPLLDATALILPPSLGVPEWRYSMATVLSRAVMTPMLGLFLFHALAWALEHPAAHRFVSAVAVVGTVTLVALLGTFLVDSIGMSTPATELIVPVFGLQWVLALIKLSFSVAFFALLALSARALGRQTVEPVGIVARS